MLQPAQDVTYLLGMKLLTDMNAVTIIHNRYLEEKDRLLQVIKECIKQREPKPTWRVIVKVLKDVGHHDLAKNVEEAHCGTTRQKPLSGIIWFTF